MSLDRTRLARVLAMIGSSFDGEALAAARRAHEAVKADGLTWEQVLDGRQVEIAIEACRRLLAENDRLREQLAWARATASHGPSAWSEPRTTADKIDACINCTEWMSGWERDFVCNLAGWRGPLTPKQQQRLDELVTKLRCVARARGLAA